MAARPIPVRDERGREIALALIGKLDLAKQWQVTVEPLKKKRSLPQNAWMHAMWSEIADETGNTLDDIKDFYKDAFLGKVTVNVGGEERIVPRSTTSLSTIEAAEFCEKIHAHAASVLGIYLPHPDDLGRVAA